MNTKPLTVGQLIEILKAFPADMPFVTEDNDGWFYDTRWVETNRVKAGKIDEYGKEVVCLRT